MTIQTFIPPDGRPAAAAVLAGAFAGDPMMTYLVDDDARRRRMLPLYFASVLRQSSKVGRQFSVSDQHGVVKGAAIAMPPGSYPLPTLPQLVEWRTMVASGLRAAGRHFRDLPPIDKRAPTEPHWYLMFVGVDPASQGNGYGVELVNAVIARADRDNLPTYLVTMKQANLGFYARFGFAVRDELRMGKHGPSTWTMLRPACRPA